MSEEKHAAARIPIAEGGLKNTRTYAFAEVDPLLECFRLRERAGASGAVLVIDNLEMIFASEELVAELASIITLLDDPRSTFRWCSAGDSEVNVMGRRLPLGGRSNNSS